MLRRFFGSPQEGAVAATPPPPAAGGDAPLPARPVMPAADEWVAPLLPEVPLPPAAELAEEWRQEVARGCLDLRERHPSLEHGHGERLLVKIAVDLEFTVRQPSAAAQEAFCAAGDTSCELPALVRIIERDAALTRALLRTSGSAIYGGNSAPSSTDDAVRRLGAKGVQVAVLAGMAEGLLARPAGAMSAIASQVWAHMVRTGPLARTLARAFDVPAHEAFVLGLLHDVGKLVLCDVVGALREALRRDVLLADDLALDALVTLHEPLGGLALLRWGVDPRAARAVATHHRARPELGHDRLGEVVFLAERLDLARSRGREIALDRWHAEGRLTASPARVAAAVEKALAEGEG
jgi:HD-like signal output (HDOD) protein